jgi:hypothetical protein
LLEDELCLDSKDMSLTERSEMLSALHKVRAELGAINSLCLSTRALAVGIKVELMLQQVNDVIAEFQPDAPEVPPVGFPRRKF